MHTMIKVLGIGDNVADKYLHTKTIYPGGNALNIAVFAKLFGTAAGYLGTFGDDEIGQHVHSVCQELGLDLSHCRYEKGENGCARVQLVEGDRVFLLGNKGGISREKPPVLTKLDIEYISQYDLLHTSVYSFMESELPKMRVAGPFISMDFSNRLDEAYFKECCPYIDCAEISCGDMEETEIRVWMQKIKDYGCRHIVIATRGSRGAFVMVDEKFYEQSPCLVKAKDTMGAGDSFIACFLINYLEGMSWKTDFGASSGKRGITTAEEYTDILVKLCLYRAAVFSSKQCQRDGSFGYGKRVELTEKDKAVMKIS